MNTAWIIFWSALILGSIAWYGFLVIHIGIRAGRDIRTMIDSLREDNPTGKRN